MRYMIPTVLAGLFFGLSSTSHGASNAPVKPKPLNPPVAGAKPKVTTARANTTAQAPNAPLAIATFIVQELQSIQLDKSGAIVVVKFKGWRNPGNGPLHVNDAANFQIKGCGAKFEDQHLLSWVFFNKKNARLNMTTEGQCLATTTLGTGDVAK